MRKIIPKDAKLIPSQAERVFKGIIFDVYHWRQEMFDGSFETFEMLKRPDTVQIIAIKDNKIVTIVEEQPARGAFYGIPGGRHDRQSESESDAAKRELFEETGLTFHDWRLIDVEQVNTKMDYFVYRFLATNLDRIEEPRRDSGERISVELHTLDEVKKLADSPKSRQMANEIFARVTSLNDLLMLPEYTER